MNRYDASGNIEQQFEPNSDGRVLRNLLGICSPAEMNDAELRWLTRLSNDLPDLVGQSQRLRVADLRDWHRRWLGNIYPWAGNDRTVNLSKGGFTFAAARQIPPLLEALDSKVLAVHTPCIDMNDAVLSEAIAIVHVELILIHPFREGNGRLARLLANAMAMQAGRRELDFSLWTKNKSVYFKAIQAGLDDYRPMIELVKRVLRASSPTE